MPPHTIRSLAMDELRRYTPWVDFIEGKTDFKAKKRDSAQVLREYGVDKWGKVLEGIQGMASLSEEALVSLQGIRPQESAVFALGDTFYLASYAHILAEYDKLLFKTLKPHKSCVLVELGCGLGDKLLKTSQALHARAVHGGEYTEAGVEVGRILSERWGVPAHFYHFDYNAPETLMFVPEGAVVYTAHSIEQIPSLKMEFVEGMVRQKPEIVYHFEPVYDLYLTESYANQMRRRYTEMNDYNRNLFTVLRRAEDSGILTILNVQECVFSDTPFNPTTIISWKPNR